MKNTGRDVGDFVPERIAEWATWIHCRELMRRRREDGFPPPWLREEDIPDGMHTLDGASSATLLVMRNTRFCNVRRMDDKVSIWLLKNWYRPYLKPEEAIVAALMARMINKPETLTEINEGKRYDGFDFKGFTKRLHAIKNRGDTVFTSAYIINAAGGGSKIEYVMNGIHDAWTSMRNNRHGASLYMVDGSMEETWERLQKIQGVGSFIAGQLVADLRHVYNPEGGWLDRLKWAPPGPGSSKGMRYLLGNLGPDDLDGRGKDMRANEFLPHLQALVAIARDHPLVQPVFNKRRLEAHDIQNTLCELSKFVRVAHGGHAKNQYDWKRYRNE